MPKFKPLLVPFLIFSLSLIIPSSTSAESSEVNVIISEEVGAWGSTPSQKRTGQQEAFVLADQLDSEWNSSLSNLKEEGTDISLQASQITLDNPNRFEFLNLNGEIVTVMAENVDMKNISDQNDLGTRSSESYQYKAKLDLPGAGANTYNGDTMQDFAPIPTGFAGQYYANESQNGFGDQNNFRNGLLFTFSQPLQAFGVWVGDLETRTDGFGTPALLRLFGNDDEFISETVIPPNNWITDGDQNQSICGTANTTTDLINKMGCGHNTTRFIGFSSALSLVKRMLIIVGDDDNFIGQPEDNNGNTEHISFIGPTVAFFQPKEVVAGEPEEPQEPEVPAYAEPKASNNPLSLTSPTSFAVISPARVSAVSNFLARTGEGRATLVLIALSLIFFSGSILFTTKQSRLDS
jgi:hypothetical protein